MSGRSTDMVSSSICLRVTVSAWISPNRHDSDLANREQDLQALQLRDLHPPAQAYNGCASLLVGWINLHGSFILLQCLVRASNALQGHAEVVGYSH